MLHPTITALAEKIIGEPGFRVSFEDSCRLADLSEDHPLDLMVCAEKIRARYRGKRVFTCAIVNAKSGLCPEDCAFCAQSSHHDTRIDTYPLMSEEDLVRQALLVHEDGAEKYGIVTSGYALTPEEIMAVTRTAGAIRKESNLSVCASLGMLSPSRARELKASGITRYHHNLETARSHFHNICSTHDYEEDVETVRTARAAGLEVCSGGILGLGESWEQRVELAFLLRDLEVDSIPLNFLTPIPGTRMGDRPLLQPMEALRVIGLFRFIHPTKDIVICGGRGVTLKDYQSWVFLAGANGLMVGNYLTTRGRNIRMDMEMIDAMGLEHGKA